MDAKYAAWQRTYLRSSPKGLYWCVGSPVRADCSFYNGSGDNGDAATCSEAHGYAMLIATLMRNQDELDGLLHFFLAHRNRNGLMQCAAFAARS